MSETARAYESDSLQSMADVVTERVTRRMPQHPSKGWTALVWANFALLITVLFFSGVFYQRVVDLELRVRTMNNTETLTIQIQDLKAEVTRLRDRLENLLDRERSRAK